MPHGAVLLSDGVNINRTPTLNQFGLSGSQLIRYQWDSGYILCQKLGGWTKYISTPTTTVVRSLWAWEDINANKYLSYGTQTDGSGAAHLVVYNGSTSQDITPTTTQDSVAPAASSTLGLNTVTLTDSTVTSLTSLDSVYILTHISVGGLILFGLYSITALGLTTYQVAATDALGNPLAATATSSAATVAQFSVSAGSPIVTVTLNNHGYITNSPGEAASTYTCLISTTLGGITVYGNYTVDMVLSTSVFTIVAGNSAASNATAYINGGNAAYIYSFQSDTAPAPGTAITATDWAQANWGSTLISCPVNGTLFQPIVQWTANSTGAVATILPGSPTVNDGIFIAMPQRQVVAWGSTVTGIQDPLLIVWSDVNNLNVWTPTILNQAGSYRIPRGSRIVGAIQGPQQGLIWTDVSLWSMQYIGGTLVYSFNEIGTGCGLIARKAAASFNGVIYWMGPTQFFNLTSDGIQPVSCPVWDVIFQDLDTSNLNKIRVAVNSRFNEIAWYYPTVSGGGEVSNYVKFNVALSLWDVGTLGRSAWIDQSVLGAPIGSDPSSLYIYQHETSNDADGVAMKTSFQTGYWSLAEGDDMCFVDQIWPDMRWGDYGSPQTASLSITLYGVNYPGDTPTAYGPYSMTQAVKFITTRLRKRLLSVAVSSSDLGSFWRIGRIRYRYAPDGKF